MSKLAQLRARLLRLRGRRRNVRLAIGHSALAVAAAWTLAALFLADWLLEMNKPQRAVTLAVAAGVVLWAVRRFTLPWLGRRETLVDMALLVQRQEQIDSDVVAALQFESPDAAGWGSVQLEQAVIDRVAELGGRLKPLLGLPKDRLARRIAALAVTAAVLGAAAGRFPDHAAVFFNRLVLGSRHYPTRTTIESVAINGRELGPGGWGSEEVMSPYGRPVRFEVVCSGELPAEGLAVVTSEAGGAQTEVALASASEPASPGVYAGDLPRLVDAARCQLYLGDAWTDPVRLVVVPPPVVDVELEVTPPGYAAAAAPATETVSGLRQLAVSEGSRVRIRVLADKELEEASVAIEGAGYPMARQPDRPLENPKDVWTLDPQGTPLARVTEPVRYAIQVRDCDGLELERPIEGLIRIKIDHPPQIVGSTIAQLVLPTARPTLLVSASDDFGLSQIAVLSEVVRADGSPGERGEQVLYVPAAGEPPKKSVQERYRLSLAPLKAAKGDQVRVTLRAVDFRGGDQEGKTTTSEPVLLQVTDERGIYAAMADSDRESIRQLQSMIESQIDVGEGK